ncbi:hypothetical protein Y032_0029g1931 [Ancylostoma ceylanicum]|nr:hypothetical protein Y032_0029g1931 [Ancylostoma ceylanicum]
MVPAQSSWLAQSKTDGTLGIADPTAEFLYEGTGRFNSIDFKYEYQEFRGTIDVANSDDMKLVVDKDDLRILTARERDITTDGLTRIPTAFRSAFKNFVLHIAGQQQGSVYSVKIDAVLSSMV